ncbi:TlpA family protein disulfide reductase [Luteolibacter algae]|uniref:TlpA family protein disulfide reductase n=1 Tax=Luteolibacter algae TaxID=454151 RepID=A0ABW5DBQ7_9BACT
MAFLKVLAGISLGFPLLFAQLEPPPESPLSPREDAVEQLLSERESLEALEKAIVSARELGTPEQVILEARFLFHVDRAEDKEIAALLPQFLKQKDNFKLADSEIFGSVDDWLAVTEYVQAIASMQKGDKDAFKQHITEAFWLSPRQGAAFAPHIDRMRLMDAMRAVRVDFGKNYTDILSGKQVTLGNVLGDNKGLLLHFWSPWSRECEATLPDFFITADHLLSRGISVASVLPETSEKVTLDALKMLKGTEKRVPGVWIVDTKKSPISNKLRVQSVPAVVLISAEGKVLFNGHPTDDEFWRSLERLDPRVERPEMREEQ